MRHEFENYYTSQIPFRGYKYAKKRRGHTLLSSLGLK